MSDPEYIHPLPPLERPLEDYADRLACVAGVRDSYKITATSIGADAEKRYLPPGEIIPIEGQSGIFYLPAALGAIARTGLYNPMAYLPDRPPYELPEGVYDTTPLLSRISLGRLIAEGVVVHKAWGLSIVDRAHELGVPVVQEAFVREEKNERTRWQVGPDYNTDQSPLLTVDLPDEDIVRRYRLRLDDVYAKDPAFLQARLRRLHAASVVSETAHAILHAHEAHDTLAITAMPRFMSEVFKLPLNEQHKAIDDMITFLKVYASQGYSSRDRVRNFASIVRAGYEFDIERTVHFMNCRTQSVQIRDNNEEVYYTLWQDMSRAVAASNPVHAQDADTFMKRPELLLPVHREAGRQDIQERQSAALDLLNFVSASSHTVAAKDLLIEVQAYPRLSEVYQRVQSAFAGSSSPNILQESAIRAAKEIAQGRIRCTFARIVEQVEESIGAVPASVRDTLKGAITVEQGTYRTKVSNEGLQTMLVLLALVEAERVVTDSDMRTTVSLEEIREWRESIRQDLQERYQQQVAAYDDGLASLEVKAVAAEEFIAANDITPEDVALLEQALSEDIYKTDQGLLKAAFLAILLTRRGEIQMGRPSFAAFMYRFMQTGKALHYKRRSFLKQMYPDYFDESEYWNA